MNILLIFAVILYNLNSITCYDKYSEFSSGTDLTVQSQYKCDSGSAIKSVQGLNTYHFDETITCNDISFSKHNGSYNLTIGYKKVVIPVNNSPTVVNQLNGDITFTKYGQLNDPVCKGGKIYILNIYKNHDRQACSSKRGLTDIESDFATFRILGGKCEGTCSGKARATYSPELRN